MQLGKPIENAYIESFNGRFRYECCLYENVFISLEEAVRKIQEWRKDFKTQRLHSSVNNMTPHELYILKTVEFTNLKLVQNMG